MNMATIVWIGIGLVVVWACTHLADSARADEWEAYMHVDPRRFADHEVLAWETRQELARVARERGHRVSR